MATTGLKLLTERERMRAAYEETMGTFARNYPHNPCGRALEEWPICYHGHQCANGLNCEAARRGGCLRYEKGGCHAAHIEDFKKFGVNHD